MLEIASHSTIFKEIVMGPGDNDNEEYIAEAEEVEEWLVEVDDDYYADLADEDCDG